MPPPDRCPHDLPWGTWCPSCQTFAPVFALLLAGCSTLPAGAELVEAHEVARAHEWWSDAGQPHCLPLSRPVYRLEADADERAAMCRRDPAPGSCLDRARLGPFTPVWVAVVTPGDDGGGLRHEILHAFEWQCVGYFDYAHTGPHWDAARSDGGIP